MADKPLIRDWDQRLAAARQALSDGRQALSDARMMALVGSEPAANICLAEAQHQLRGLEAEARGLALGLVANYVLGAGRKNRKPHECMKCGKECTIYTEELAVCESCCQHEEYIHDSGMREYRCRDCDAPAPYDHWRYEPLPDDVI